MDLVDGTIVNVAAPSIRGDLLGRRRLFIAGIVAFTTSSVLCAVAPSIGVLIALRGLQGASGALLIPQGFGMLKEVFPPDQLTKAFAAFGPVMGLSAVIAPILGGALIDADLLGSGWRAIFLVNAPLGVAGLIGALRVMPRTAGAPGTRLDPGGAVIASAAAFALIYPLIGSHPPRELGWPAWSFVLLAAGIAGFGLFAAYERRHRERALIAPSLLANRAFTSGIVVAVCFFAGMIGLNLVISLFCQVGEHFSPLRTGSRSPRSRSAWRSPRPPPTRWRSASAARRSRRASR